MSSRAELEVMLRPAAGGIHVVEIDLGGDIMEVAPPLRGFRDKTALLAARYFRQTIASTLRVEL